MKFKWKPGSRMPIKAGVAGKHLLKLYKEHKQLTPEIVVASAAKRGSPIRECFEWSNLKAAEEYRKEQARRLLRFVTFIPQTKSDEDDIDGIRLFFPIFYEIEEEDEKGEVERYTITSYRTIHDIMDSPDDKEQLLQRAMAELQAFRRKYAQLSMLDSVFKAIDRFVKRRRKKKVSKKKQKKKAPKKKQKKKRK